MDLILFDFSRPEAAEGFRPIGDRVMGGVSTGRLTHGEDSAVFSGEVSFKNRGGFASVRSEVGSWDLSNYDGIQLRVKGDGRRYTWQLQTTARYRGYRVSYWADFDTRAGEWNTVNIPFSRFYPQVRGFKLAEPELDPSEITELGLYIYDKKDGAFELHLDSIAAY